MADAGRRQPVADGVAAVPGVAGRPWSVWLRDLVLTLIVALIVAGVAGVYYTERYAVASGSMEPTLEVGDVVWAVRRVAEPERGGLVAFANPGSPNGEVLIKRVIGLPGERVEAIDGQVLVNRGELDESFWMGTSPVTEDFGPVELGPEEYFVMGDNRGRSIDSRHFGPVPASAIGYVVLS